MKRLVCLFLLGSTGWLMACGDDSNGATRMDAGTDAAADSGATDYYRFASRFEPTRDSVDHKGQTTRSVLIEDLVGEMKRLSEDVRNGTLDPTLVDEAGEVTARLNAFFRESTTTLGTRALPALVKPGTHLCQTDYSQLGDAKLIDKVAGEDDVTDHRDWDGDDQGSTEPAFLGWSDSASLTVPEGATIRTPVGLIQTWFQTFETQVRQCVQNDEQCPKDPGGTPIPLYVTPQGLDLAELVEKFLLGAIHFSQATDDYLDDDAADTGKGLLGDHTVPRSEGAADTVLEHAWDEAYGYFGAAVDYKDYTDDEIRASGGRPEYSSGYHDFDGNGCIDVFSEINFGPSVYAAKRDSGSVTNLDLTTRSFQAFLTGRRILASANGALSEEQLNALREQRDIVVATWEQIVAASVIHYLNETISASDACGTASYDFVEHAAAFSEMKGFALYLQFNPRSPFNTSAHDFAALHQLLKDAPVLCAGNHAQYKTDLLSARAELKEAYGFSEADVESF